jgi:hypothetical protein
MKRKVLLITTGLLLLFFMSPRFNREGEDRTVFAFVDVGRLTCIHPRYQEVLSIEEEMEAFQAEALRLRGAISSGRDAIIAMRQETASSFLKEYSSLLESLCIDGPSRPWELNQALKEYESQAHHQMERKKEDKSWELAAKARELVGDAVAKSHIEKKMAAERIMQTYSPEIFKLKLKIELLDLSIDEAGGLREELTRLKEERDRLLAQEMATIDEALEKTFQLIIASLEEEMVLYDRLFKDELEKDMESKAIQLEEERQVCALNFRTHIEESFNERRARLAPVKLPEVYGSQEERESELLQELERLALKKTAILADIEDDVQKVILNMEECNGVEISPTYFSEKNEELDFTWKAMDIIACKYGRGGG